MKKRLLDKIIVSAQNPLLSVGEFFKYCKKRFENIGYFEKDSLWLLNFYKKEGLMLPAFSKRNLECYSTFQVYNLYLLEKFRKACLTPHAQIKSKGKAISFSVNNWKEIIESDINKKNLQKQINKFNKLLLLLFQIQDLYLPEVRSDRRFGEYRDYHDAIVLGGTYFVVKKKVLLSAIRKWRRDLIKENKFKPQKILYEVGLTVKEIEEWTKELSFILEELDPLIDWYMLLKYISYDKRQRLKGNALLAQDLYEIAQMLILFLEDLGEDLSKKGIYDIFDWFDLSPRDKKSKLPDWKEKKYGKTIINNKPYKMLEFLTNEYEINPKPHAIIFTEGEEWQAIAKLFEFYGYDPDLLGIEFRSIKGEGNFSLSNWQCFIEYMHEKQVLIYFLVDNEGETAKQAKRLLRAKRKFIFHGLKKVIPGRDRIKIWGERKKFSSFEEVNFTDAEIAQAINMQINKSIKSQDIRAIRNDPSRKKGLIEALKETYEFKLNKSKLDIDLVNILIEKRKSNPDVKNKRPIEKFILKTGRQILLNYQPTSIEDQHINLKTGLFG